ncbi:MAG: BON domain-containing protein [Candidatus Binataceae bacterium]
MKRLALTLLLASALLGFGTVTMAQDAPPTAAGAMSAAQQSNSQTDVALTREIRRAVVKDQSLSMLAHNVKIVSVNGSVTLLGPVKTEAEKDAIASKAQAIAGADKVHNQLEVKDQ